MAELNNWINQKIKNFSKFPAFRTKEDAIAALKILAKVRKTVNANN